MLVEKTKNKTDVNMNCYYFCTSKILFPQYEVLHKKKLTLNKNIITIPAFDLFPRKTAVLKLNQSN